MLVIHRVGELKPTDPIVLVVVTSAHRGEAFAACEFVMDYLKTEAPFWKKETTPAGARWVDARDSDDAARERWETAIKAVRATDRCSRASPRSPWAPCWAPGCDGACRTG